VLFVPRGTGVTGVRTAWMQKGEERFLASLGLTVAAGGVGIGARIMMGLDGGRRDKERAAG
jgi:hypothetical protein